MTPEPPPGEPEGPSRRWPWIVGAVAGALAVVLGVLAIFPVPYYLQSPGSTYPTSEHIEVVGAPTYDHDDDISFTTVSLQKASALQAIVGWMDPSVSVKDEREILGDRSPQENRELNLRQMASSQQVATAVALEQLGYDVVAVGTGAVVLDTEPGSAADGLFERGDTFVGVDGRAIGTHEEMVEALGALQPGDVVVLTVESLEAEDRRDVEVVLGENPDQPGRPFLGVSLGTRDLAFDAPLVVTIDSGDVGGPSAGLALTLGIIDVLSPESITHGVKVATTGTISIDGRVGPVGGVEQKTVSVRRAGVELFLVPTSELELARHFAGGMRVEAVDTVDEAMAVLESLAP